MAKVPASVWGSRSTTTAIKLKLENGDMGWADEGAQLHALGAVSEATGKPLYIEYQTHDPTWGGGAGAFTGVVASLDPNEN